MRDTRKRFEDYMILDYRLNANIIEYHPLPAQFRLIRPHESSREPVAKLFYKENVTEKLKWIAEKLDGAAKISFLPKGDDIIYGIVSIKIKNFPAVAFAKRFKIERILEKGIRNLDVIIYSGFDLKIIDSRFFGFLTPALGWLTIGSVDEKTKQIIRDEEIILPLELQQQTNN